MSARSDTWMPLYWGDYSRDTGHLDATAHGSYLLLIRHYWCNGEPLRDDDDELWRIACCNSKRQWMSVRDKVVRLFVKDGGFLRHKRVDREIVEAEKRFAVKSENGKKGAEKRWHSHSSAIAQPSKNDGKANGLANGPAIAEPMGSHRFAIAQVQPQSESSLALNPQLPHAHVAKRVPKRTFAALEEHVTTDRETGRPLVNGSFLDGTTDDVLEAARIDTATWTGNNRPIIKWLADGYEPHNIVATIERIAKRDGYTPPATLAYFDKPVRSAEPTWLPNQGKFGT